jgi:hypothetical protein
MAPDEAMTPDPDFLLLHTLRCIGFVTADRLATASGLTPEETNRRLGELADRSFVSMTPGPFGGWALTDEGRGAEERILKDELELTGALEQVRLGYESFLRLNPTLLQISTDWQMVRVGDSHVVNDHRDPEYDAGVLDGLVRIDAGAQRICADLADRLGRFGIYGTRLAHALDRALAGDVEYLADGLESYHSVWFQLHEDLLATLGISREEERGAGSALR